jgi:O-antigen/teichoic acid export membrane protein
MWDAVGKIPGLRDVSTIGIVDISTNIISAIFWLFVASTLGAEKYGEISYFIAIASIASTAALLGTENIMTVLTAKKINAQSTIYFLVSISTLISSIIIFILFDSFEISLLVIAYVITGLALSDIIGRKFFLEYAKYIVITKILMVVFGVGFYYILGEKGVILGLAISSFPYFYRIYKSCKETKIDFNILRKRIKFVVTNYGISLGNMLAGSTDKLIIAPLLGFALLGNYQLGLQFLAMLNILPAIVYKYILPHDASGESSIKLKLFTILASGVIALVAFFYSPWVILQIFPKYLEAAEIIPILSLTIIPSTVILFYTSKFLGREDNFPIFIGSIMYLTMLVILIIILGKMFDLVGIAIAFIISVIIQMIYFIIIDKLRDTRIKQSNE